MNKNKNFKNKAFTFLSASALAVSTFLPNYSLGQSSNLPISQNSLTAQSSSNYSKKNKKKTVMTEQDRMSIAGWDTYAEGTKEINFLNNYISQHGIDYSKVLFDNVSVLNRGTDSIQEAYVGFFVLENLTENQRMLFEENLHVANLSRQSSLSIDDLADKLSVPIVNEGTRTLDNVKVYQDAVADLIQNNCQDFDIKYNIIQVEKVKNSSNIGEKYLVLMVAQGKTRAKIDGVDPKENHIVIDFEETKGKQFKNKPDFGKSPLIGEVGVQVLSLSNLMGNNGFGAALVADKIAGSPFGLKAGYMNFDDKSPTEVNYVKDIFEKNVNGPITASFNRIDSTFKPVNYHVFVGASYHLTDKLSLGVDLYFADMSTRTIRQDFQVDKWTASGLDVDPTKSATSNPVGPAKKLTNNKYIKPAALTVGLSYDLSQKVSLQAQVGKSFYKSPNDVKASLGLAYKFAGRNNNR